MLKPLEQWICDICGNVVEKADAYVIWRQDEHFNGFDFKIIHTTTCDRRTEYPLSMQLSAFLGHDGLAVLLANLSAGPIKAHFGDKSGCSIKDMNGFVDFVRRVQTPYYEEARRCFGDPEVLDLHANDNEVAPYLPENLKAMIEKIQKGTP